ncbi:Exocyst complex component EXO84 [Leucoagaricus sp. SymC.cos]|nr:Exocyst complex component EXO84 [Leucoagaricus sp. SymC.cos]
MDSSLRTRRPSQATRKPARSPSKLTKLTSRDARKSRVDDKIKKRMSMRYADISAPIPSVPPVPAITPASSVPSRELHRDGDSLREKPKAPDGTIAPEDKKLLSSEDFDPDAFIKLKLANSTEAELKSLQSSLRVAKDDTASDLQRSVFKNYAEFVLISKEISVLENELLELKDLLSDYKSMPSVLHIPDPTSSSTGVLSTYKRSSVADLRILYFNQMQTLHASIEGAAKFVPNTPGRHVVSEMEGVFGLNAATYKVVGKVKFVILDDAVLVARRRRRNAGTGGDGSTVNEGKLVAERCWPLNDMLVLDTKDSPNMTNVFKIRQGKETHVYRTETTTDKKSLLAQFRQVADELAAKKRKEREGEHERRKSMWQGGDRSSVAPPMPEWMADLARKGGDFLNLTEDDDAKAKAERDARWVGEWSDDLTVAIALREWTKAVDLVEKGQARLSTIPALQTKLPSLTNQLTAALLLSLSVPSNKKTTCVMLISLLTRLKAAAAARKTYLEMRTGVITGLMRRIRFEGDIGSYVGDLSVVWFTGIKHTADWYLSSFKDNESTSALVVWAQEQLKTFAEMFRKQVYTKDVEPDLVKEAIAIVQMQGNKLLREHGLDFNYLLDQLLVEKPKETERGSSQFSFSAHRLSKQGDLSALVKQLDLSQSAPQPPQAREDKGKAIDKEPSPIQQLPPAPPPPTLSAPPPPARRRSPAPPSAFRELNSPRNQTPPQPDNVAAPTPTSSTSVYSASASSAYPTRNRTPISAGSTTLNTVPPSPMPLSLASTPVTGLGLNISSTATPRRTRGSSPPPSAPGTSVNGGPVPVTPAGRPSLGGHLGSVRGRPSTDESKERDWETASTVSTPAGSVRARNMRTNPSLPPRSVNRPGSLLGSNSTGGQSGPRGVVPRREGMF